MDARAGLSVKCYIGLCVLIIAPSLTYIFHCRPRLRFGTTPFGFFTSLGLLFVLFVFGCWQFSAFEGSFSSFLYSVCNINENWNWPALFLMWFFFCELFLSPSLSVYSWMEKRIAMNGVTGTVVSCAVNHFFYVLLEFFFVAFILITIPTMAPILFFNLLEECIFSYYETVSQSASQTIKTKHKTHWTKPVIWARIQRRGDGVEEREKLTYLNRKSNWICILMAIWSSKVYVKHQSGHQPFFPPLLFEWFLLMVAGAYALIWVSHKTYCWLYYQFHFFRI